MTPLGKIISALILTIVASVTLNLSLPESSGTITVVVPPEPVKREGGLMVAKEVTGAVTIVIDGKTYTGTLTFPDTKVRRKGIGEMLVDQCTATGVIK